MEKIEKVFLNINKVSELLCVDINDVKKMVNNKSIPYCLLPTGQYIFHKPTIIDWALSLNPSSVGVSQSSLSRFFIKSEDKHPLLVDKILSRFRHSHKSTKSEYINLYKGQKVFAQLHFPSQLGGIDLALCECGNDKELPRTKHLSRFQELWKLHGYQRNNKPWLEGTRISNSPAAAFNIPVLLEKDDKHPGWTELEQLLTYSFNKR